MTAQIIPFKYGARAGEVEPLEVRVVSIDGEPWFVLTDLARVLDITDVSRLSSRLDDGVRQTHPILDSLGRTQQTTIVSEAGMYEVVIRSDKPEAFAFRRWITSEVLPSIRRHGGYLTPDAVEAALTDPDFIIRLATDLKAERAKRVAAEEAKAELAAKVAADEPKVLFAEAISVSKTTILVRELAKLMQEAGIKVRPNELFEWLRRDGFLIRQASSDRNLPTQKSEALKLFQIKETPVIHDDGRVTIGRTPKVTGKGQAYLIDYYLRRAA